MPLHGGDGGAVPEVGVLPLVRPQLQEVVGPHLLLLLLVGPALQAGQPLRDLGEARTVHDVRGRLGLQVRAEVLAGQPLDPGAVGATGREEAQPQVRAALPVPQEEPPLDETVGRQPCDQRADTVGQQRVLAGVVEDVRAHPVRALRGTGVQPVATGQHLASVDRWSPVPAGREPATPILGRRPGGGLHGATTG